MGKEALTFAVQRSWFLTQHSAAGPTMTKRVGISVQADTNSVC